MTYTGIGKYWKSDSDFNFPGSGWNYKRFKIDWEWSHTQTYIMKLVPLETHWHKWNTNRERLFSSFCLSKNVLYFWWKFHWVRVKVIFKNLWWAYLGNSFQSISHVFLANDFKVVGAYNQRIVMPGTDIFSCHSKRFRVFLRIPTWLLEKWAYTYYSNILYH